MMMRPETIAGQLKVKHPEFGEGWQIAAGSEVVAHCSDPNVAYYILHCLQKQADFEEWRRTEDAGELPLISLHRELLQLLAKGKTTQEIALILKISCRMVEFRKKLLMRTLSGYKLSKEELSKQLKPTVGETDIDFLKNLLDDCTEEAIERLL